MIALAGAAGVGLVVWASLRAIPRVAVSALRSDIRVFRRARRCFRRTITQLVLLAATIAAAVFPIGAPAARLGWVVIIWLVGMVVSIGERDRHPACLRLRRGAAGIALEAQPLQLLGVTLPVLRHTDV
ncbi:MAG: hypothetical protein M3042_00770 [Actinomycetota bacterium]|nr:hypothetical protein [Actinomycetota bacterium]